MRMCEIHKHRHNGSDAVVVSVGRDAIDTRGNGPVGMHTHQRESPWVFAIIGRYTRRKHRGETPRKICPFWLVTWQLPVWESISGLWFHFLWVRGGGRGRVQDHIACLAKNWLLLKKDEEQPGGGEGGEGDRGTQNIQNQGGQFVPTPDHNNNVSVWPNVFKRKNLLRFVSLSKTIFVVVLFIFILLFLLFLFPDFIIESPMPTKDHLKVRASLQLNVILLVVQCLLSIRRERFFKNLACLQQSTQNSPTALHLTQVGLFQVLYLQGASAKTWRSEF